MFVELQHNGCFYVVLKTIFLLFSERSLQQRKKTLSAAAEEGCRSKIFLATADHCGRLEELFFHRGIDASQMAED